MTTMDDTLVPVIDLAAAVAGAPGARRRAAAAIDRACRETGFFTVTGHPIAPETIDAAYDGLRRFLALPRAARDACRLATGATMPHDPYTPYGYSALLEENAFAYMGEAGRPADYVEKFSVGRLVADPAAALPFPPGAEGRAFREALAGYFAGAKALAGELAGLFETGLGLSAGALTDRIGASNDSLRCHGYPARSPMLENDQGMGAHRDGSLITLLTHTSEGIELRRRGGGWMRLPFASRHAVTVNIGDLLAHVTGGAYVSTPHRVVLTGRPRLSIVFFKLTEEDELVAEGNRQMDALFGR